MAFIQAVLVNDISVKMIGESLCGTFDTEKSWRDFNYTTCQDFLLFQARCDIL